MLNQNESHRIESHRIASQRNKLNRIQLKSLYRLIDVEKINSLFDRINLKSLKLIMNNNRFLPALYFLFFIEQLMAFFLFAQIK